MNAEERTHWILGKLAGAKGYLKGLEPDHPEYGQDLEELYQYFLGVQNVQRQRERRRLRKMGVPI